MCLVGHSRPSPHETETAVHVGAYRVWVLVPELRWLLTTATKMAGSTARSLFYQSPRLLSRRGAAWRGGRHQHTAAAAMATPVVTQREPALYSTIANFRRARRELPVGAIVGFVPTMGALHDGHAELFRRARLQCDVVVGSVYINPTQFAAHEDLDRYPRQLEKDLELLRSEGLADMVFAPGPEEMYSKDHRMYVDPVGFDDLPEGVARPGFFRGVVTIVTKLLNVVQPDFTYFGQKDALQCISIKKLVADLNMPVEVVVCETRREADGVAMSSRNAYMTEVERAAAPVVYMSLQAAAGARQRAAEAGRRASREEILAAVEAILSAQPLVRAIEYMSVGCPATMSELEEVGNAGAIVSVAVKMGPVVRLIDNIVLPPITTPATRDDDAEVFAPTQQQPQSEDEAPTLHRQQ